MEASVPWLLLLLIILLLLLSLLLLLLLNGGVELLNCCVLEAGRVGWTYCWWL